MRWVFYLVYFTVLLQPLAVIQKLIYSTYYSHFLQEDLWDLEFIVFFGKKLIALASLTRIVKDGVRSQKTFTLVQKIGLI